MLLLHGTLLIYAVVSVFAKLAGLRLAAQDAGMTLAFLAAEAAALPRRTPFCGSWCFGACR